MGGLLKEKWVDWGTGADQISMDSLPDGNSYERISKTAVVLTADRVTLGGESPPMLE